LCFDAPQSNAAVVEFRLVVVHFKRESKRRRRKDRIFVSKHNVELFVTMPTYNVRGVKVEFPFQAYEVQQIYMEKVIEALQDVRFLENITTPRLTRRMR
jgi:hypothetical protein